MKSEEEMEGWNRKGRRRRGRDIERRGDEGERNRERWKMNERDERIKLYKMYIPIHT